MFKNVASQGVYLFAWNVATNAAATGDAANITATISKDGAAESATATAHPTEIGGGIYWLPLSQAESNCDAGAVRPVSATANIQLDPVPFYTAAQQTGDAYALGKAMPILDTSTTPWSIAAVQQGTGTAGAKYLDGTILRRLYLRDYAFAAIATATTPIGSQADA